MLLSKIKKIPKNTNGRLAIPALAGLLVSYSNLMIYCRLMIYKWCYIALAVAYLMQKVISCGHKRSKIDLLTCRGAFLGQRLFTISAVLYSSVLCIPRLKKCSPPPKTFWNIFTSVKFFCVKFCEFVSNSYPLISANFCTFI